MNSWHGIGNLGQDPTLRTTPSGKSVTTLSLAVDRFYYKTNADGSREKVTTTDWIPIVVWDRDADRAATYLQKGSRIAVTGQLRQRKFTRNDGSTVNVIEVHAENIEWISKIRSASNNAVDAPVR